MNEPNREKIISMKNENIFAVINYYIINENLSKKTLRQIFFSTAKNVTVHRKLINSYNTILKTFFNYRYFFFKQLKSEKPLMKY